ncbi:MAG: S-layer homology domain-containing protein, partial [Oscillibacter sp.]|nr:S-layer homology domain-containing protein [Oscillibacter sp.]
LTVASLLTLPAGAAETAARFSDISDQDTIMAVESLRLMGVLDGYDANTFRPDAALNRGQFCKMAVYAMDAADLLGQYKTVTVFPDVKPSHWAAGFINLAAKGKNIISGYPDGRFHPDRTVTVGQAVTIMLRLLGYKDENIGGVWPDSYMAVGATIGLTEGIGASGNSPLTRGQAARLFLNLLRADMAEGGSYLSSIGATALENQVLVTSSAKGSDGREASLQLASGTQTYQLASGKVSNGALHGSRGTLALNKTGKVLTFVPDSLGASITITVATAKASEITDVSGAVYTVTGSTRAYRGGEEAPWSEIYSWVSAGSSVTLYLNTGGGVDYIFVGSGSTANSAVIVYGNESTAGFADLVNGATNYKIYKNGAPVTAKDIRRYDVATYSPTTNSIRVCDTRISGFYESCSPNPSEPETITVLGYEFPVLATAQQTISKFKPGDQMVLLLTEDNQVAGAVEAKGSVVSGNAIGIVRSGGRVDLLCGITLTGGADDGKDLVGQMVRVSSTTRGRLSLSRLSGGNAGGNLDVAARTMGQRKLADNVMIFQNTVDGVEAISLSSLTDGIIPAGRIVYARVNSADKVDLILINSGEDGTVLYGRVFVEVRSSGVLDDDGNTTSWETIGVEYGNGQRTKDFRMNYNVNSGDYVAVTLNRANTGFSSLKKLEETKNVPNSAWTSENAVTVGGRTYTVPSNVLCYNSDMRQWVPLSEAHSYADKCNIYTDGGYVRCIEVSH